MSLVDGSEIAATIVVWVAGVTVNGTLASTLPGGRGPGGRPSSPTCRCWIIRRSLSLAMQRPSGPAGIRGNAQATIWTRRVPCVPDRPGRHPVRGPCCEAGLNRLEGRESTGFVYRDRGVMATVGRRAAVAQLRHGLVVSGTLGWLAWLVLHLVYLIGFRNRFVVLVNWTWSYFRWPSGPRIIVGDVVSTGAAAVQCPECRSGEVVACRPS